MAEPQVSQQILKFTVQHYKHLDRSDEEFMEWYSEVHRPRMVRLAHKHNVFRYSLNPDELRTLLADPEWDEEVQSKEESWVDTDRASIQVGFETVFVEDGQIIEPKV
ncbi:hypothetical protein F5Y04DRAFT_284193 [Hypomontagnella monticulosa]|nr:hypothetical protein F5Y04DRAFT_284193 [Hypomontagnella monticulosa]